MDINLIAALIGMLAGAVGYWMATFWIQPILRYRSIRNQIHSNFIYYAQVINSDGLSEEMKNLYRERILVNRKTSAELSAASLELPFWYAWYLCCRRRDPVRAAQHLIGYSNTVKHDQSYEIQMRIRKLLGLPSEI